MWLPTTATCELQVLYQLLLSVKAYGPTSNIFHNLGSGPLQNQLSRYARTSSLQHLMSGWNFTLQQVSLSESFTAFGRAHNVHRSIKSSQGCWRRSTYQAHTVPKTPSPFFRCIRGAFHFCSFSSNIIFRKENFSRYEIFKLVRFNPRLFSHSWNLQMHV